MRTYILFWNPAISSYKLDDFQEKLRELEYNDLNWSVWEHEKPVVVTASIWFAVAKGIPVSA